MRSISIKTKFQESSRKKIRSCRTSSQRNRKMRRERKSVISKKFKKKSKILATNSRRYPRMKLSDMLNLRPRGKLTMNITMMKL